MNRIILCWLLLWTTGCHAQPSRDIRILEDILYYEGESGRDDKHRLDLYMPVAKEEPPLLLWVHGGAWAFGDRKQEKDLASRFAEEGIAVAAISYRLSPALWADPPKKTGAQHPAHIQDVARAFSFLRKEAPSYGYDQQNIFISGYSAGGHLSALLVLDQSYLNEVGSEASEIKAVIPLAGAYDLLAYYAAHERSRGKAFADKHVKGVFGPTTKDLLEASVTHWVSDVRIPMLVIAERETATYTQQFENAVRNAGVKNIRFHYLMEETHRSYLSDLGAKLSKHRSQIVDFITQQSSAARVVTK